MEASKRLTCALKTRTYGHGYVLASLNLPGMIWVAAATVPVVGNLVEAEQLNLLFRSRAGEYGERSWLGNTTRWWARETVAATR